MECSLASTTYVEVFLTRIRHTQKRKMPASYKLNRQSNTHTHTHTHTQAHTHTLTHAFTHRALTHVAYSINSINIAIQPEKQRHNETSVNKTERN